MPTFEGSLQLVGDSSSRMPAGIRVDGGKLTILAGASDEIGSWNLGDLNIRRKSGSFVLTAEGEELLFSVDDPENFIRLVHVSDSKVAKPKKEPRGRSRKQRKVRPPKEPKVKPAKKTKEEATPPIDEPPPTPTYMVESTPAPSPSPEEVVAPPVEKKRSQKTPSLFAAIPLSWKVGAALVALIIILFFIAPGILAAILMVTGMITLGLAVVVGTDSIVAARLPAGLTSTTALVGGIILLVLSVLVTLTN